MSFSERLQKKLLPSTQLYIKTIESRYQEPMKQAQLINKEIATLRNPRNLRAARSRSAGAYTQLLQHYLKAQESADKKNADFIDKVNAELDNLNIKRSSATAIFQQQKDNLDAAISETLGQNFTGKGDFDRFKGQLKELDIYDKNSGEATLAALFAMRHALSKTESEGVKNFIREEMKSIIKTIDDQYRDATDAEMPDVDTYINEKYPDLSRKTAQGRKNRAERLSEDWLRKNYALLGLRSSDLATYRNYQPDIDRLRSIVFGNAESVVSTLPSMTPEQQEQFVKKEPGLTVEEGRVVVDPAASPEKQKGAQILLNSMPDKNPTPSAFIASPVVRGAYSGLESGERTAAKMEARAQELEQLRDQRLAAAQRQGRLTPAQISVLTNPLFTRTKFRGQQYGGYLPPRASDAKATAAATPEDTAEDVTFGGFPEVDEPTAEPAADSAAEPAAEPADEITFGGSARDVEEVSIDAKGTGGVQVIPAVLKTLDSALADVAEAQGQGNEEYEKEARQALTGVINDFNALPEDIRNKIPTSVRNSLVSMESLETSDKGFNPESIDVIRERLKVEPEIIDSVGNVSNYMVSLGDSEERLPNYNSVSDFLMTHQKRFPGLYSSDLAAIGESDPEFTPGERRDEAVLGLAGAGAFGLLNRVASESVAPDKAFADFSGFQGLASKTAFGTSVDEPQAPTSPIDDDDYDVEIPSLVSEEESKKRAREGVGSVLTAGRVDPSKTPAPVVVIDDPQPPPGDRGPMITGTGDSPADRVLQAEMRTMEPPTTPVEVDIPEPPPAIEADQPEKEDTDESELLVAAQPPPPPAPETPEQKESERAAAASAGVGDEPGSLVIAEDANREADETLVADSAGLDSKGRKLPRAVMPRRRRQARDESQQLVNSLRRKAIDIDEAMRRADALAEKYPDFIDPKMSERVLEQYLIENVQFKDSGVEDVRRMRPFIEEREPTETPKLSFVSPVATKDTIDGRQVITSDIFGDRPDPVTGKIKPHEGIDFRARLGEPIFAAADGVIQSVDRTDNDGAGLSVSIKHSDGSVTKYFHASSIDKSLKPGDQVKAGQEIMKAGKSGNVSAPHLHFELMKPNEQGELVSVNPLEHMRETFSDFVVKDTGRILQASP